MNIKLGKLPAVLTDEVGNKYDTKKHVPTGRTVDWHGKFKGWQFMLGNYLVRIVK